MKMKSAALIQICLVGVLTLPLAQPQTTFFSCANKEKCSECIRTYGCIWCSDPDYKDIRCLKAEDKKCSANFTINPKIEAFDIKRKPLTNMPMRGYSGSGSGRQSSSSSSSSQEKMIQITPQHIKVKLRPNEGHPYKFKVVYKQAEDYPVDLYYLMDLSFSMNDDKDNLAKLGNLLAQTMSNITRNFRLGFGSFVDKVVMPYVSMVPKNLMNPCDKETCAAPYGFQNVMSLSQDTSKFAGLVRSANVSGNLDAPEGGFDAIMQAIVCKEQIGWRNHARKLLVFSTDSSFHFAGDGKLGGIVKPNDGCCHLDYNGLYTHSTLQDYPSVSQINAKVKENSINIIFAVTSEQAELYGLLKKHIEGSSFGQLTSDSGNVVELVKEQYNEITSSIEMKGTNEEKYIRLKYKSNCLDKKGPLVPTNQCDGLTVGAEVEFEIEMELLACPENPKDWNQTFFISPGLSSENLQIDVELQCDCGCENPDHQLFEQNSAKCSRHGSLKCGVCECEQGYSGDDCSCTTDADKIDECRPNSTNVDLCSNHGICKCNKCDCKKISDTEYFYGKYCECDSFTCPRTAGILCSGRGKCDCGKCRCSDGWIGDDCSCENSISNCTTVGNEICSGHGKCVCNKCVCDQDKGYSGKFCDKCPQCPNKCSDLKNCVQCKVHESGPLSKEECKACDVRIEIVEYLKVEDENYYFCSQIDDQDCRFTYMYEIRGKDLHVVAQKNRNCPPSARILGVVFSVILSIVLIGLAFLLVWKFITSMRDRREFAKFEKERMMAKWDTGQNPIYKQATSTFKNPTYCGS